jgi:hypothetical protein
MDLEVDTGSLAVLLASGLVMSIILTSNGGYGSLMVAEYTP